jgi:hypothetical protein
MGSFEQNGLTFQSDRTGVSVDAPEEILTGLDYEDLDLEPELAAEELGRRLSALTSETIADEEGLFDLAVFRGEALVAALIVSCDDDGVDLSGERTSHVTDEELAAALLDALRSSRARSR